MGRSRYKIYDEKYPYFITSSVINWVPIFRSPEIPEIILDGFRFLQKEREVTLYAYVIMLDHIHFIVSGENLSEKIRLFKSYVAREIIDHLKAKGKDDFLQRFALNDLDPNKPNYQIWQKGFHPKQIIGDEMMSQKIKYIHANPIRKGYVSSPEKWEYSSYLNYVEGDGILSVTCFEKR